MRQKGRGKRAAAVVAEHARAMALPTGKVLAALGAMVDTWKRALARGESIELPIGEVTPVWAGGQPRVVEREKSQAGWLAQESEAPARRYVINNRSVQLSFRSSLEFLGMNAEPVRVPIDRRHLVRWRPGETRPAGHGSSRSGRRRPEPAERPTESARDAKRQTRLAVLEYLVRRMQQRDLYRPLRRYEVPSRTDWLRRR